MFQVPVFCRAITVFLVDKSSEQPHVLLLRRLNSPANTWSQITGAIESDEAAWQAALREVHEETGILLEELWSADTNIQFYVSEKNCFEILPVFVGYLSKSVPVTLNNEHDAYQWFSFVDAKALVSFPGQRNLLDHIESEFINRTPTPYLRIHQPKSRRPYPTNHHESASP